MFKLISFRLQMVFFERYKIKADTNACKSAKAYILGVGKPTFLVCRETHRSTMNKAK